MKKLVRWKNCGAKMWSVEANQGSYETTWREEKRTTRPSTWFEI
jgi:hypothetical protein